MLNADLFKALEAYVADLEAVRWRRKFGQLAKSLTSVTGPPVSIPFEPHPAAGVLLLYAVGARPLLDGVGEDKLAYLNKRSHLASCVRLCGLT